ncbi:MAG: ATP-binding protein [Pirellulales bacterium]|nr:ATP-binding protein [Pirellulales bacterium]
MLIEFRVENHRSLRDEQVLTMEAGRVGDESDPRPRQVSGHSTPLLTVAGLYGANASGKSNVLAALAFMLEAVLNSHRRWSPDRGVPRDPFAWGRRKAEPSTYEVEFLLDGVRYQYGFMASDEAFLEEWLYAWPRGKKQTWFERDGTAFKFGHQFKGENKLLEEITRPNALFLSVAAQNNHPLVSPVFVWFASIQKINLPDEQPPYRRSLPAEFQVAGLLARDSSATVHSVRSFENKAFESPLLERFRDLLSSADVGITDLRMEIAKTGDVPSRGVLLRHSNVSDDAWLPLKEESHGTQVLFVIAIPILRAMETGTLLLVDEFERSLHPAIVHQIIDQFNDPVANPKNAQVLFTTHDTNLLGTTLGEPALRRDQVWLTEKDSEGTTTLYPLTDYKPRKAENLERGYLQGRYGAIPFLGDFLVTEK